MPHSVGDLLACIQHDDRRTHVDQVHSAAISRVVVGGNDQIFTGKNSKAIYVSSRGGDAHHTGRVVVAKGDAALQSTCCHDGVFCTQGPESMPGQVCVHAGQMVGYAFEQAGDAIVVETECGSTSHDLDALGLNFGDETRTQRLRHRVGAAQQVSTQHEVLLDQPHLESGLGGFRCRRQTGNTAADDQQIAESMGLVVVIWIGLSADFTHACCFSNDTLAPHPIAGSAAGLEGRQTHEGFVVEAGSEKTAKKVVDGAEVESYAREGVLTFGHQAVEQLLRRRFDVWISARATTNRENGA